MSNSTINVETIEKLSQDQVFNVLDFAQAMYGGIFNPFNSNRNMLEINGLSIKPDYKNLCEALENFPYTDGTLSNYSEFMKTFDNLYSNIINYYKGLLSFDLTYSCINKDIDYNSKEYKDDIKRIRKFFDVFDYKYEFKSVLGRMLVRDVCYTWFRDTNEIDSPIDLEETHIVKREKFGLQEMPWEYCKLTGYFNNKDLLYDFDMSFFEKADVDINLYAPCFKNKLKEVSKNNIKYSPSSLPLNRDGHYMKWVQNSPKEGAWAFKFDTETFGIRPPFIASLKECLTNEELDKLAMDRNIISSYYLLAGEIGMLTGTQAQKQDQTALTPNTLGTFMSLVSNGLNNHVKPIAMPVENIRGWQFDNSSDIKNNHLRDVAGESVSASEMIYHTDNLSQFALENAIYNDYTRMEEVYSQFSHFLDYYVNKKTKKYKFKFQLSGLNRQWYKEKQQTMLLKYADKGIVLTPCYYASVLGIDSFAFERAMEEAHNGLWENNLTMLLNMNTMNNSGEKTVGRPEKEGLESSDKTEEMRSM